MKGEILSMGKLSLAEWRRAKKITQQEVADGIKVHVNTITRWEANPEMMSIGDAKKIAAFLEVPLDDIDFLCAGTPTKLEPQEA